MLGKLIENVEGTFDPDEQQATKLDKLSVTRTVHANCLKKDYWQLRACAEVMEEKLDAEMKSNAEMRKWTPLNSLSNCN